MSIPELDALSEHASRIFEEKAVVAFGADASSLPTVKALYDLQTTAASLALDAAAPDDDQGVAFCSDLLAKFDEAEIDFDYDEALAHEEGDDYAVRIAVRGVVAWAIDARVSEIYADLVSGYDDESLRDVAGRFAAHVRVLADTVRQNRKVTISKAELIESSLEGQEIGPVVAALKNASGWVSGELVRQVKKSDRSAVFVSADLGRDVAFALDHQARSEFLTSCKADAHEDFSAPRF